MASADGTAGGLRGGRGGGGGAGREVGGQSLRERQEEEADLSRRQFAMAKEYLRGRNGVAKDEKRGVELLKAAAHSGLADAQLMLAESYHFAKHGIVKNNKKEVKWYRRAADQGHARAQFNLGVCYKRGEGVDLDFVEAARLYRLSAEQGFANAQCHLGWCYNEGEGVDQSYEEAVRWYRRAVDQGLAQAQNNLAGCYLDGNGVEQDYAEAAKFSQLAADQDHKLSQAGLGLLYFEGHGVQRNCDKALQWLRRSGNTYREVTDAIAQIEKSASELLDKKTDAQRSMIEAGESAFGQTQDGTGDYALHVAAREVQADTVALLFDHSSFDDLVLRANTAGELPRDVVSAGNPAKLQAREARALRSILSVTRRTRAACVLWCFEMLHLTAPERLIACIPRDIVCWEIVKHVLPPKAPGSLQCGVVTLMNSPVAWLRPCLAIAPPIVPQPTSPAEVLALQQQHQQQQQQQQQQRAQPSTALTDADDTSERGLKRTLEEAGAEIIDVDAGEDDDEDDELREIQPASKRPRS